MGIRERLTEIRASLPDGVELVAVSKFHPAEVVREAYDAGQRMFGESRVQELTAKQPLLPSDIEWHFIGTLQTNKVRHIAPFISLIHSVDSLKLLREINLQAARCGRRIDVLLEVHIAEEATKYGFSVEEIRAIFAYSVLDAFPNVRVRGLMGMATFTDDVTQVRREFASLKQLYDTFSDRHLDILSMGMSDDYPLAIAEGSTMVRIGTRIFGNRT
ncbi:MAG: YggS family pyridoxal phosphate-dependent enzyme [Tannerella sp.]|jgi:pyridoxal phosphate enzyme (YggS family)|nr:YggS family pyridoxal phosphate-dependent enzyme [Tannerella sp.]